MSDREPRLPRPKVSNPYMRWFWASFFVCLTVFVIGVAIAEHANAGRTWA